MTMLEPSATIASTHEENAAASCELRRLPLRSEVIQAAGRVLAEQCHAAAVQGGWWNDLITGKDLRSEPGQAVRRNIPELLCLVHSEISEALEGYRKDAKDEHLPARPAIEVELADAIIRIFDLGVGIGLDIPGAIAEKLEYNLRRLDHTHSARLASGGKKF